VRRAATFWARSHHDERGVVAVFSTLLLVVMLGFAALLIDLGQLRATSRNEQLYVDFAALAAGRQLSVNDANGACKDAVTYLNANDPAITTAINSTTFCSTITNTCNNATTEHKPSITVGKVWVSIHYPVPASEIQDSTWTGVGKNDGPSQCQRMRVIVETREAGMFSRILGVNSSVASRSATMRPTTTGGTPPALWVLDPTGCVPLKVDGGSQVTVGTSTVKGVITVDSNGTTCGGGATTTVSATGSGTTLHAIGPPPPTGDSKGEIRLTAMANGSTACSAPACDPADVAGGRIDPQPIHGDPASRSYVDWAFNCKTGYPIFHGITQNDCPYTAANGGTRYPYIDNLKTAIGNGPGAPSTGTWTTIGPGNACSPNASHVYPVGNYYVKCTKGNNGFVVNSGVAITFSGGNVVFEDNVTVSNGGTVNINTANTNPPNPPLSASCIPPTVQTPCIGSSSSNAAFVYIRGDSSTQFSTSGTGTVNLNHVFVYGGTGSVGFTGNPPTWTAPLEGPFNGLAYWTDMPATATNAQKSSFTITGGSGANLSGVFFTPEASPFKLAGGGNWGQLHAQFISYQLTVTGGGVLSMAPDPTAVTPPSLKGYLIR
jgi:Flp pilus assembly protein TadG